jgi:rhodanese-related sulfurtransferase
MVGSPAAVMTSDDGLCNCCHLPPMRRATMATGSGPLLKSTAAVSPECRRPEPGTHWEGIVYRLSPVAIDQEWTAAATPDEKLNRGGDNAKPGNMMFGLPFGTSNGLDVAVAFIEKVHDVPSMTDDRLEVLLQAPDPEKPILLDVRTAQEFEVSHIEGAVQVDPDTTSERLRSLFPDGLEGKTVVATCSVGERSAVLIERLHPLFTHMGAAGVYNLRGGLFRWYANGREVVDKNGPTDHLHPFNALWGMLVSPRSSGH